MRRNKKQHSEKHNTRQRSETVVELPARHNRRRLNRFYQDRIIIYILYIISRYYSESQQSASEQQKKTGNGDIRCRSYYSERAQGGEHCALSSFIALSINYTYIK